MESNEYYFRIYVVLCCIDDRLECSKIAFDKEKAVSIWENFTNKNYEENEENCKRDDFYDYSKTAGSKIFHFDVSRDELVSRERR